MLGLVEVREPPGEGGKSRREPWLLIAFAWLLPWPALIVWLLVASRILEGWPSAIAAWTAVCLCVWRGMRLLPESGLSENRQ